MSEKSENSQLDFEEKFRRDAEKFFSKCRIFDPDTGDEIEYSQDPGRFLQLYFSENSGEKLRKFEESIDDPEERAEFSHLFGEESRFLENLDFEVADFSRLNSDERVAIRAELVSLFLLEQISREDIFRFSSVIETGGIQAFSTWIRRAVRLILKGRDELSANFARNPFDSSAEKISPKKLGVFSRLERLLTGKIAELSRLSQSIKKSEFDLLTGLRNRRGREKFINRIQELISTGEGERSGQERRKRTSPNADRRKRRLDIGKVDRWILISIDIDHFKKFNDQNGHSTGDAVLQSVAQNLLNARGNGVACRSGGEEFELLVPVENGKDESDAISEIFDKIHEMDLELDGKTHKITLSGGVKVIESDENFAKNCRGSQEELDALLYAGKALGRDTMVQILDGERVRVFSKNGAEVKKLDEVISEMKKLPSTPELRSAIENLKKLKSEDAEK